MDSLNRAALAAAVLIAAPLAAPAIAQTAPGASARARIPGADAMLATADTSKDGTIDRDEWLAAGRRERGFDFLDGDGNGKLDRAELDRGVAMLKARAAAPAATPK